jgi:antitoxin component of MazEF toxin-antitoxin module
MVTKTLTKVGNSQAMFLDKTVLGLVDAGTDTIFKITIEGRKIVLEPISPQDLQAHTMKLAREVMDTQSPVLKKLAE